MGFLRQQWTNLKTAVGTARERVNDVLSDWIVIDGVIEKSTFQVRPSGEHWAVTEKRTGNPYRLFNSKKDAIAEAMRMAREKHGHLIIFSKRNTLQSRHMWVH